MLNNLMQYQFSFINTKLFLVAIKRDQDFAAKSQTQQEGLHSSTAAPKLSWIKRL
jgi:hypothetical protein